MPADFEAMVQPKVAIVDYTVLILAEMWSCGNYHAEKMMVEYLLLYKIWW